MFNKHFLWLFQNVSILTEPGTNHDASLFLRAASLSCRTIFTGRNRRFPCCIRPGQNTPGQTKAPFSPRNAEKRVQVNVFTWPCRNRHSPVRSPQALSSEKLRSAVLSEVLNGTDHLRGVGVLVVVPRHDLNLGRCRRLSSDHGLGKASNERAVTHADDVGRNDLDPRCSRRTQK